MSIISSTQDPVFTSGMQMRSQMMINDSERLVTDSTVASSVGGVLANVIFPGRAMTIESAAANNVGKVRAAKAADTFVYGLTDTNNNAFQSDVRSLTGEFGSGKANIYNFGRCMIRPNVYLDATGAEVTVNNYDPLLTYIPGDSLFVTSDSYGDGLLSNAAGGGIGTVVVGKVLKGPSTVDVEMELSIVETGV